MKKGRPYPAIRCPLIYELRLNDYIYSLAAASYNTTSGIPTNPNLRAVYYPVPRKIRVDRIAIWIAIPGAAGVKARLGIYHSNGYAYPGALLVDAGEVAIDVAGIRELAIDEVLEPGTYFLAFIFSAQGARSNYTQEIISPIRSPTTLTSLYASYSKPLAYGALPDPYPAGAFTETELWTICLRLVALL